MMSPLARGLFHRAISQSGTATLRAFITPDPLKVAKVGVSSPPGLSKKGQDGPEHLFSTDSCPPGRLYLQQHTDSGRLPEGTIRG